jgi:hypothetical protein
MIQNKKTGNKTHVTMKNKRVLIVMPPVAGIGINQAKDFPVF